MEVKRHGLEDIKLASTALAKALIWRTFNHHVAGDKPDIWIFGCRRSGSTLLMQMVAVNPSIKFCNQPFALRSATLLDLELLQGLERGPYIELDPELEAELRAYVGAIRSGEVHTNEPWSITSPEFSFRSNRIVFKMTDGLPLISWFSESFGGQSLVLIRHPISQSLSAMRNRWLPRFHAYLKSESFVSKYISESGLDRARDIASGDDLLSQHVLTWCCENAPLLRHHKAGTNTQLLAYEDILRRPIDVVELLATSFDLPDRKAMMKITQKPSLSARLSTPTARAAITRGDSEGLLRGWERHVSLEERKSAMSILEVFGIDFYQWDNALPVGSTSLDR